MEPVHTAFSLRWKILAWFFVNLLVIGGLLFVFLRTEFHVGVNSLLAGPTNDRLESIARPLALELRNLPSAQWNAALQRAVGFWHERGLRAGLYRSNGDRVMGDAPTPPREVVALLGKNDTRRHGLGGPHGPSHDGGGGPGQRGGGGLGPGDDRTGLDDLAEDFFGGGPGGPPPGHPPDDFAEDDGGMVGRNRPPREELAATLPKFMVATDAPRLYWAGVGLGEVQRPRPGGPPPGVCLVLVSTSLRGGGLFFDYVPWLLVGGGLALVSVLLWLPFVHGLTRALARMTNTAEEIAQGRFHTAPPARRRDELGRLGRALGHMAHRLDGFVTGQRRFLGDTAHELLSPLARLEVALSILEQQAASKAHAGYAARALDEVRHLADIVQDLLSFTKAGMRPAGVELEPVPLAELVEKAVRRESAEKWIVSAVAGDLKVCAEPDLLVRALANAVRNAVRYAGDAGPITITAQPGSGPDGGETVSLVVADQGPGVPPGSLDRLFDPFYRPEDARTRETGGNGLGLAIVKSCVEACGGQVSVCNRVPHGLELTFTLHRA